MHMKTVKYLFDEFMDAEYEKTETYHEAIMHCVCLIWASSPFYNDPGRIVVLLREICNMIIEAVTWRKFQIHFVLNADFSMHTSPVHCCRLKTIWIRASCSRESWRRSFRRSRTRCAS